MSNEKEKRIILVVDDNELIRHMLKRNLRKKFDEVLITSGPREADLMLREHRVTHLLCDCNLGPDVPMGYELIPGWRAMQPSIVKTVVFTGSDLSNARIPPEVDCVVSKTDGITALLETLES